MGFFDDDLPSGNDDDYEVGYRKPPKHSRFKKGQSGNPQGKRRGTKNSATLLKQALLASVLVKQNGHEIKATKLRVIVTQIINQAMRGDYASTRLLLRYAGLDRQLNEPKHEQRGLSAETGEAIRRALYRSISRERAKEVRGRPTRLDTVDHLRTRVFKRGIPEIRPDAP